MNRSILIVICDFLLVSLLAFSTVDINQATDRSPSQMQMNIQTNQAESGRDLAAVMRSALEEELHRRDLLMGELTQSRETVGRQQQELAARQQELAVAETNLQALNQRATKSNEKLSTAEVELRRRAEQAVALQQQLAQSSQSNQMALAERQRLIGQLELAEIERRHAAEQVVSMQKQVDAERAEKTRLAAGVQKLATISSELTKEIRENRALAPNAIFDDVISNRVQAAFTAVRPGLFGGKTTKRKETNTILVQNEENIFALCHIEDTPLDLRTPAIEWDTVNSSLSHGDARVTVRALSFYPQDPRLIVMPVDAAEASRLGGKIYRTSSEPYKFQDAVLIGTREDYYGECKFEIDTGTPGYVKLDRSVLRGIFGKFNPSRGDLVLSKQDELLGVMINNTYCLMLQNFVAAATLQLGNVKPQHTSGLLSSLNSAVLQLPRKLQ